MREGFRRLADGFALAFGIAWILLAVLFVGCLVLWSSGAQHLTDSVAFAGAVAGFAVWVCGGPIAVSYAVAIMRRRYVLALSVVAVPLVGMWAACRGPVVASNTRGPVLAIGFAAGLACLCVAATVAIGWVLRPHSSPRKTPRRMSHSPWKPPITT